jgi:hypothetical protein
MRVNRSWLDCRIGQCYAELLLLMGGVIPITKVIAALLKPCEDHFF